MQEGWICKNGKYGTWFLSKEAVIKDWKNHQAYHGNTQVEPMDESIDSWFNEQISWIEVSAYGKQLEEADMKAWERIWLEEMKYNTNYIDHVEYIKA